MARGIAAGERVVSQANTEAYDQGYDASGLGKSKRSKERGSWVWDDKAGKLVRPWEHDWGNTKTARSAPISVDRHYEGVPSPIDGTVFQSRRQHREYMRARNLTTIDDFNGKGGQWERAEAKRALKLSTPESRKDRRERIGRRMYEIEKTPQAKYDREVKAAAVKRARRGTAVPTE